MKVSPENSNKTNKTKQRFFIESLGLILIALSPFIFKIHEFLPKNEEETISFLGITFDNNGFEDLSTYAWFLLNKIIPLYLLIIWFFTCKHWWYHIILIPLCMYAFQIFEVIFYWDEQFIDTENVLWLLPICMVVIPFVYLVRIKLYDKYVHGIDLEAMDAELQLFREKEKQQSSNLKSSDDMQHESQMDLSEEVSNKTLSKMFSQFQHTLKNLFNFML
jgi:hypothetical protein